MSLLFDIRDDRQPRLRKGEEERWESRRVGWKVDFQVGSIGSVFFRFINYRPSLCRDSFREMLESVSANGHTFEECKELLKKSTPKQFQFVPANLNPIHPWQISNWTQASANSMNGAKRTTSLSSLSQGNATFPAFLFIASHRFFFSFFFFFCDYSDNDND